MRHRLSKIFSGGQSGVDRAALDVALRLEIPIGGWCPRGRVAEDGKIPAEYPLRETATQDPAVRTELNVLESDGTLSLNTGSPNDGTVLTKVCAQHHRRPYLEVDLDQPIPPDKVLHWCSRHEIRVLNIAGPRESHRPGFVYKMAIEYLLDMFS